MTLDASPAFQPDRGLGGFQLAADGGFQTQGPRVQAELALLVGLEAVCTFRPLHPPEPSFGFGVWLPRRRQRRRVFAALGLRVGLEAAVTFEPAPRQRQTVRAEISGRGLTWTARTTRIEYVREVLIPAEDEELVLLLAGERHG